MRKAALASENRRRRTIRRRSMSRKTRTSDHGARFGSSCCPSIRTIKHLRRRTEVVLPDAADRIVAAPKGHEAVVALQENRCDSRYRSDHRDSHRVRGWRRPAAPKWSAFGGLAVPRAGPASHPASMRYSDIRGPDGTDSMAPSVVADDRRTRRRRHAASMRSSSRIRR